MKKLPIGIQSFAKIRTENYHYVDKTAFVAKLVNEGAYYFFSRPRRFGKSLFLDTLKQAFLGRRDLFAGLRLENHWDWAKTYPIVHLDFAGGVAKDAAALEKWILVQLKRNQDELGIDCHYTDDYRAYFEELIWKTAAATKKPVVVLIDEYDKPILDRLEDQQEARNIREVLKNLYSVLKPRDADLKFVFFTGVSKFSKVSLFSGLNQLQDITLNPQYATLCGYTQAELEDVFAEPLQGEDLTALRSWYNGYSFLGETVYNPLDILLYLAERQFRPYWFETGTPSFLIKLLLQKRFPFPHLEHLHGSEKLLGSFDLDFIEPENLLFQTGYLTIKDYERVPTGYLYHLTYPNKEVKIALNQYVLGELTQAEAEADRLNADLYRALRQGEMASFAAVIRGLFAAIPYEWYRKNEIAHYEGFYASVVYSFLAGAGLALIAENYTNKGRIDLTILYENKAFLLEFKVVELEGPTPTALAALKTKGYQEKYTAQADEIYLLGIDFSKEERNIATFAWEKL